MIFEFVLFNLFGFLMLVCSLFVILAQNPIHSVLFLVLVFFNTCGLIILLQVEFLAMLFLIVYVGAIAVLFLFVIMMLNITEEVKSNSFSYLPIGCFLSIIFLFEIIFVILKDLDGFVVFYFAPFLLNSIHFNQVVFFSEKLNFISNIQILASVIYVYYFYFFLLAGLILLVAMIGAITLTLYHQIDVKKQDIYKQHQKMFKTSIDWKTIN